MADTPILENQLLGGFAEISPGMMALQAPLPLPVAVGETYRVVWGADSFVCKAFTAEGSVAVGNLSIAGLGEDTQEPFLVVFNTNSTTVITNNTNITTVVVSIYHVVEDKEYLIWGSTLKGIADAIREKTGKTDDIPPNDMPGEIRGITGGGSDVEVVYVTFLNHDGSGKPFVRPVVPGNTCVEPVGAGLMATPTRESTESQNFTFSGGWATTPNGGADANALKNVTEDRTVYANYIATTRFYNIRFFDGETQIGGTLSFAYGSMPNVTTPTKDGFLFDKWEPELSAVTGDADYCAKWIDGNAFVVEGWCGPSAQWGLTLNGELIISGSGAMNDYSSSGGQPWSPYMSDIKKITVSGLSNVSKYAFYNCTALTSASIANGVELIDDNAFVNCTNLTQIDLPDAMVKIAGNSFNYAGITELTVPVLSETCNAAFRRCQKLRTVTFREGQTHVYYSMFSECSNLASVYFPASIVEVNAKAFYGCALTSVVFENPNGWSGGSSTGKDLSNPSVAASALSDDARSSMYSYVWKRT